MTAMALDTNRHVLDLLIQRGATALQRYRLDVAEIENLVAAAEVLRRRPADGVRTIDDHTMLYAQALRLCAKALAEHDNRRSARYGRVVAVLIDDLRSDFSIELDKLRRPTA